MKSVKRLSRFGVQAYHFIQVPRRTGTTGCFGIRCPRWIGKQKSWILDAVAVQPSNFFADWGSIEFEGLTLGARSAFVE
jgi:hypothetical protein